MLASIVGLVSSIVFERVSTTPAQVICLFALALILSHFLSFFTKHQKMKLKRAPIRRFSVNAYQIKILVIIDAQFNLGQIIKML